MAVLTVGELAQYQSIGVAVAAAAPGDVVRVLSGVYREPVRIDKAITVEAAEGHAPIIDGGWDGQSVTDTFGGVVSADARGVIVRGLEVRNCPGRGIGVGSGAAVRPDEGERSDVTIEDCYIHHCYKGGLGANPPTGMVFVGLIIRGNLIQDVGLERLVTGAGRVNGSFLFTDVVDSVIQENTIVNGLGEGINIDRNSRRNLVNGNRVINCAHVGIYVNCAQENVIEGNVVVWSGARKPVGDRDDAPSGIIIGDERGASQSFRPSAGNVIAGNVVVGAGTLFQVRNNSHNYNTSLDEATRIVGNTFVAGPQTERGLDIAENQQGRPHGAAEFTHNIIDWTNAPAGAVIAARAAARIRFHHNGWTVRPTTDVRGEGDIVGDLMLSDPAAVLVAEWGTAEVGFDIDNYRPLPESPVGGAGVDGRVIGALEPLPDEPPPDDGGDDEPEPPGLDVRAIIDRIAVVWGKIGTAEERLVVGHDLISAGMGMTAAARAELQELIDLLEGQAS